MAYATTTEVNYRLNGFAGFTVDGSSSPNSTAVGTFLDEASAMIDSALTKAGYLTVPATGTNDAVLLRKVVADYVAYQTYAIAFAADGIPETFVAMFGDAERFMSIVNQLENGGILLQDQQTAQGTFVLGTLDMRISADEDDLTDY